MLRRSDLLVGWLGGWEMGFWVFRVFSLYRLAFFYCFVVGAGTVHISPLSFGIDICLFMDAEEKEEGFIAPSPWSCGWGVLDVFHGLVLLM